MKDEYYSRIERGLCPNCPNEVKDGHVYCKDCRIKKSRIREERLTKIRESKLEEMK